MDAADIVEIPPPIHLLKKQKKRGAILHDVIYIDDGGGSEDLVIIGEKVNKSKKGKTIEAIHQVVEVSDYTFIQPVVKDFGPAILHDVIDIDDDDDSDDLVIIGEKVSKSNNGKTIEAIHQVVTHLDNVDIPLETEAPFTWLPEYDLGLKKSTFKNSPWYDAQSDAKKSHATDFSQLSWSLEPSNSKIQGSTMGSSNLQIKMDNVDHSCGTELSSSSQLFSQTTNKKKSAASQRSGRGLNLSLGVESSKSKRLLKSFRSKMKSASFGSKHHGLAGNSEARNLLPPGAIKFMSSKQVVASSSSYHAIMRKFHNFKQFDSVRDASDHHFICENSSMKQHPKNWVKAIQKEWKILEKDLPDSIFVRVYESRMDLLRAVIVGAEGTPYHNGLFFFDLYFPSGYPNVPPLVHSHFSNDKLNPVFMDTGRLCLSLLNTWSGNKNECWLPRVSTILQVLVSIQGLVLNAKPFFAGEALRDYTTNVESISLLYNENAFTHSLQIMSFTMGRPPKIVTVKLVWRKLRFEGMLLANTDEYFLWLKLNAQSKNGSKFILICWAVWRVRNDAVFNDNNWQVWKMVNYISANHVLISVYSGSPKQKNIRLVTWAKPSGNNCIKVNVEGSSLGNLGRAGFLGVGVFAIILETGYVGSPVIAVMPLIFMRNCLLFPRALRWLEGRGLKTSSLNLTIKLL